jgi:hypothetical protein
MEDQAPLFRQYQLSNLERQLQAAVRSKIEHLPDENLLSSGRDMGES